MVHPESLYQSPNGLAADYSRFRVSERLLLSGHSHQAWPDCAFDGQQAAFGDAAELVDDKWERAFAKADEVRAGYARLLDDGRTGYVALGESTHNLVVRWLSALPLARRPRIVATDGEFHTLRRLLDRLGEDVLEVVKVPSSPSGEIAQRLCEAVDDRTAAVMVSAVLFRNAQIVPDLGSVARACAAVGAELLVDAYHALGVVPFSVREMGLEKAFVTGGGYKYCQLGEGNCFLRFPRDCELRPVITGWFAEFDAIAEVHDDGRVAYGQGPNRFMGGTFDPVSHYRAAEVFAFFERRGLTPELLRGVSQHQVTLLADTFDALRLDPGVIARDRDVPLERIGGFLTLSSPRADALRHRLNARGVYCDSRGDALRLGPAPYLCDAQLIAAMEILGDECRRPQA